METEKLFYADPFLTEFDARVLACEAVKDGFAVVLDRTAFYPEGGGQPYDTGVLGGAEVLDVHERAGVITHKCASPLPVGETVHGRLDWARRFDHMQQHSGEHICSGLICARYGCDNVGFHMGAESVTIDFNADIPWEELLEIEAAANRYIYEDHAIDIHLYRGAELDAIDYRSKKPLEGDVRIVTFPGADCCACCGTHVMRSGQVGIVKFLSVQKFREGVRIELLCGRRAADWFSAVLEQNGAVSRALSAKPLQTFAAVERLQSELESLKLRCAGLENADFARKAAENAGKGDVVLFEGDMSSDSVRRLCDAVLDTCGGRCAVFAGRDGSYKYAVGVREGDVRPLVKALNAALNGRGGGKPNFAQGSVAAAEAEIRAFLEV